jgi:hypothetical protein
MYPPQIDELFVLLYLEKLIKKGLFMQVLSQVCMITPFPRYTRRKHKFPTKSPPESSPQNLILDYSRKSSTHLEKQKETTDSLSYHASHRQGGSEH